MNDALTVVVKGTSNTFLIVNSGTVIRSISKKSRKRKTKIFFKEVKRS